MLERDDPNGHGNPNVMILGLQVHNISVKDKCENLCSPPQKSHCSRQGSPARGVSLTDSALQPETYGNLVEASAAQNVVILSH